MKITYSGNLSLLNQQGRYGMANFQIGGQIRSILHEIVWCALSLNTDTVKKMQLVPVNNSKCLIKINNN